MPASSIVSKLRRPLVPLLVLSAVFVAAGGIVHLREWLDTYRHVPASLPGAAVVRVGFVLDAVVSAILVVGLVGALFGGRRLISAVVAATAVFEAASLATLLRSRHGTVLGWMELGWSRGAEQTRAVEIGALVLLACVTAVLTADRRPGDQQRLGRNGWSWSLRTEEPRTRS